MISAARPLACSPLSCPPMPSATRKTLWTRSTTKRSSLLDRAPWAVWAPTCRTYAAIRWAPRTRAIQCRRQQRHYSLSHFMLVGERQPNSVAALPGSAAQDGSFPFSLISCDDQNLAVETPQEREQLLSMIIEPPQRFPHTFSQDPM